MKDLTHCPILIAVSDWVWTGVLVDAYDNDPVYYKHHEGEPDHGYVRPYGISEEGFVRRGNHYVILFVTKQGTIGIDTGYHKDEIPARAYVLEDVLITRGGEVHDQAP